MSEASMAMFILSLESLRRWNWLNYGTLQVCCLLQWLCNIFHNVLADVWM